jgi:hypothetical protein
MEKITTSNGDGISSFASRRGKNHRLFNKSDFCQPLNLAQLLYTQTSLHLNKSAEMFNISTLFQQTLTDTPPVLLLSQQEFISCSLQILPPLCSPSPISYHPTLPIAHA